MWTPGNQDSRQIALLEAKRALEKYTKSCT